MVQFFMENKILQPAVFQDRNLVGRKAIIQNSNHSAPMPARDKRLRYAIELPRQKKSRTSNPESAYMPAKIPNTIKIPHKIHVVYFMRTVCGNRIKIIFRVKRYKRFSNTNLSKGMGSI